MQFQNVHFMISRFMCFARDDINILLIVNSLERFSAVSKPVKYKVFFTRKEKVIYNHQVYGFWQC